MKIIFIISLILPFKLIATQLQWVDTQIQAIKPPREGISQSKINAIKNPFIFSKKKLQEDPIPSKNILSTENKNINTSNNITVTKEKIQPNLEAIINSSALINGQWYKIKDKIGKYTLSNINRQSVVLSFKNKKLLLSIKNINKNIKFKSN